jgi:uncharacterized protein (TIGR02246 family)
MQPSEEIVAIKQLVARYCHALDRGDGEGWASAFTEDGRFETVGRFAHEGRAAIAKALGSRTPYRSRHFPCNLLIEVDGDTATMRAYLKVLSGGRISVTGQYEDRLRKVDGQWLFVERRFTHDPEPQD